MDPRTRNLFAAALVLIIALAGGAALLLGGSAGATGPGSSGAPPGTTEVVGVIVAVDSAGLGTVNGFTLRESGGALDTFGLAALENGTQFPPGHLAEHQATAQPVRVWYRDEAGRASRSGSSTRIPSAGRAVGLAGLNAPASATRRRRSPTRAPRR